MHSEIVRSFSKKFDLVPNKTYRPPKRIPSHDADLRFSYAVGFVDGDGSIINQSGGRADAFLRIKCHSSWRHFLEKLTGCLVDRMVRSRNADGYAEVSICDSIYLKEMKRRVLKLGLPVLSRKWNVIDLDYIGRNELGKQRVIMTAKLLEQGLSKDTVARKLGVSNAAVSMIIRRNNIRAYKGRMRKEV